MTKKLFDAWLTEIRTEFKKAGRKIFMIMDNYSSHKVLKLDDCDLVTSTILDIAVIQVENMSCIMLPLNAIALI